MLHLGSSKRLSIDIDIICPPGTDISQYVKSHSEEYGFAENPKCEPTPFTQFKVMLSTFDVKHLIWNIATRLGYGKGKLYNSENCAVFIKAVFPTICQYNGVPMDISSLQDLTATSPNEKIHLDYPDPERFGFHIPRQLGEEKE